MRTAMQEYDNRRKLRLQNDLQFLQQRMKGNRDYLPIQENENWFPQVVDKEMVKHFYLQIQSDPLLRKYDNYAYKFNDKKDGPLVNKILQHALYEDTDALALLQDFIDDEKNSGQVNDALDECEKASINTKLNAMETQLINNAYCTILDKLPVKFVNNKLKKLETRQKLLAKWYKKLIDEVPASIGKDSEGLRQLNVLEKRIREQPLLNKTEGWLTKKPAPSVELLKYLQQRRWAFKHDISGENTSLASSSSLPAKTSAEIASSIGPGPLHASPLTDSKATPHNADMPEFCLVNDPKLRQLWDKLLKGEVKENFEFPTVTHDNYKIAQSFFLALKLLPYPETFYTDTYQNFQISMTMHYAKLAANPPKSVPLEFVKFLVEITECRNGYGVGLDLDVVAGLATKKDVNSFSFVKAYYLMLEVSPASMFDLTIDWFIRQGELAQIFAEEITAVKIDAADSKQQLEVLKERILRTPLLQIPLTRGEGSRYFCGEREKLLAQIQKREQELPLEKADLKVSAEKTSSNQEEGAIEMPGVTPPGGPLPYEGDVNPDIALYGEGHGLGGFAPGAALLEEGLDQEGQLGSMPIALSPSAETADECEGDQTQPEDIASPLLLQDDVLPLPVEDVDSGDDISDDFPPPPSDRYDPTVDEPLSDRLFYQSPGPGPASGSSNSTVTSILAKQGFFLDEKAQTKLLATQAAITQARTAKTSIDLQLIKELAAIHGNGEDHQKVLGAVADIEEFLIKLQAELRLGGTGQADQVGLSGSRAKLY